MRGHRLDGFGPTIGIAGGGQLGLMLALAGIPLGMRFRFLDPDPEAPARRAGELVLGELDDPGALARLAEGCAVVTYEIENASAEKMIRLAEQIPVHPDPHVLADAADRLREKRLFGALGIPTVPWARVDAAADLAAAAEHTGLPALLKTRSGGYDGRGQIEVGSRSELLPAWERLGGVPALLERRVEFTRELSVVAVRGHDGELRAYPLVENRHQGGILRESAAPAPVAPHLVAAAHQYAHAIMRHHRYVGVLALEMFEVNGMLYANEFAPRVHNSGHWTIEGAVTSQFENHLRAICGLPLGSVEAIGSSRMVNLIGDLPDLGELAAIPGAHLHLYGKSPRTGRKLGHVTYHTPGQDAGQCSRTPASNLSRSRSG